MAKASLCRSSLLLLPHVRSARHNWTFANLHERCQLGKTRNPQRWTQRRHLARNPQTATEKRHSGTERFSDQRWGFQHQLKLAMERGEGGAALRPNLLLLLQGARLTTAPEVTTWPLRQAPSNGGCRWSPSEPRDTTWAYSSRPTGSGRTNSVATTDSIWSASRPRRRTNEWRTTSRAKV